MTEDRRSGTNIPDDHGSALRTRSRRTRAVLALGTVVGIGAALTSAAFSDRAEVTSTFTAGTLDISLDETQQGNPTPYSVTFTGAGAMKPGDVVYDDLTVNNDGSLKAYVSMDAELVADTDNGENQDSTEALLVSIGVMSDGDTCDATFDFEAAPVEDSPVANASITDLIDDGMEAGSSVDLCFAVELPDSGADQGSGGGSADAIFTFNASSTPRAD